MGNYTILKMFENPRRGRQARNFTRNVPKILGLKSSSEQIFSENWVSLPIEEIFTNTHTKKITFYFIQNKTKQAMKLGLHFSIHDIEIDRVNEVLFLGATLCEHLSWKS